MLLDLSLGLSNVQLNSPVSKFMVSVDTAFSKELTIQDMLASLRGTVITHKTLYFYVLDEYGRLCGVAPAREILSNVPQRKLKEIMHTNLVKIDVQTTVKEALALMAEHELLGLPVTDRDGKLIGLFEIPPSGSLHRERTIPKASKEVFQLIGLYVEQGKLTSSLKEFRYRMPWLLCNLFAGMVCAFVASSFYELLDAFVVIAMFIPLVLTLGESVSMQSMTLSLLYLSSKKIPWKNVLIRIFVEFKTSLLLGFTSAFVVSLVYLLLDSSLLPLAAIAVSIALSMVVVTLFGSLFPILLHIFNFDPKIASGPVVLMLADISITLIYFWLSDKILTGGIPSF